MAQTIDVLQEQLSVSVDDCRIRLQTGEPIIFVDARRAEHRPAGGLQITGSSTDVFLISPGQPCLRTSTITSSSTVAD